MIYIDVLQDVLFINTDVFSYSIVKQDCCSLSALECFRANLEHFSLSERNHVLLNRSLHHTITVSKFVGRNYYYIIYLKAYLKYKVILTVLYISKTNQLILSFSENSSELWQFRKCKCKRTFYQYLIISVFIQIFCVNFLHKNGHKSSQSYKN